MQFRMNVWNKVLTVILGFALGACGGGPNPDLDASFNISGHSFTLLSTDEELSLTGETLSGTGLIRFANDLGDVYTAFNYTLNFSLENQGELSLISHANSSLANGVEIIFKRSDSELLVFAKAGDVTDDWSSFFSDIDALGDIFISIDVHNNEALTHILVWNDLVSSDVVILDSGYDVAGGPGNGYGQSWGLRLKSAKVQSIEKGGPRVEH